MENNFYPFVNLPLPYELNAMEPFIDEKTMYLHHDKHLQTYIDNLNKVLTENPGLQALSLEQLIANIPRLPKAVQKPVRNNAGGVYNHRFYFEGLANPSETEPSGKLQQAICAGFGNMEKFYGALKSAGLSVFGSGYAWLVAVRGRLQIVQTANQNCPLEQSMFPILAVDVWEHAYYLKHFNVRAAYLDDWRQVVNWKKAEERYNEYLKGKGFRF